MVSTLSYGNGASYRLDELSLQRRTSYCSLQVRHKIKIKIEFTFALRYSLPFSLNRRSSTGEGIFQFFTKHGETIADEIRHQSKHAFKSAEQKRDAFRKTSTSGSESKSPPSAPASSRRRPTRTMTAPSERSASVLKKDTGVLMENARKRAVTDPFPVQRIEENVSAQQDNRAVVGSEQDGSVSSNDLRPRSVTESSIEKAGDDEVFVSRRTYSEIDLTDGITEESEVSAYIDLVSDESMEPIHISDPVSSRKTSTDSFTSSCSLGSEEGSMRSNSSLPRTFPGAQLIPEENEMDSEGYIKCEVLQTGPAENSIDGNGNVVDYFVSERNGTDNRVCEISGGQSLLSCPVDTTTASSLDICPTGGRVNRKMRENLFAQIKDPNCGNFPPKPKLEKEHALKTENVFPPKSRTEDDAPRFAADPRNEADSRQALLDKLKDPESSKRMFEQIIAQMEKPQQNDVNELFPAVRHKRNSIGAVSLETVRDAKQKSMSLTGAGKGSHFTNKKHTLIEKSKSTCDGFASRTLSPGPPPLPVRPDLTEATRRRSSSASTGDITEDIQRRPELASAHRSTYFAKGMRSVDPITLLSPLKTNINVGHLTGEAAIQARLIEKTELRDELAQFGQQKKNSGVDEVSSCLIANGGSTWDSFVPNSDSAEKGTCNLEDDGYSEIGRRKDSRASKFVKKVWKLAPKPKRGSNESREVCEDFSERPRRDSLSPGDAVDIQGRFSGSEPNTPETSPQMSRKSSKSSPKASRKISKDEKLKKDKESPEITRKLASASKMLRKVTKGSCDTKKNESVVKKISKDESPKKNGFLADSAAKHSTSSSSCTNKEKPRKAVPPEKAQKDSKHEKREDASCQVDDQLVSDMIDSQCEPINEHNFTAPALPPRKKSDPPPLPPRVAKSPTSTSSSTPAVLHSSASHHHGGRTPQPAASSTRRHSHGSHGHGVLKEESLPPPPVPPRRENNQSPDSKTMTSNVERSSAARAPVIQLTCSSPENRQDSAEKHNSGE